VVLASIPSPSSGTVHVGPVPLHMYGILLAVGVVAGATVAGRRWARWGHSREQFDDVVVVMVITGLIGARLYHVATDYQLFTGNWIRVFEVWKGGLSIWGVIIGGGIGLVVRCRMKHYDVLGIMDAIVPGLLLAQAIGRWGNYFNQELFGKPSTLPWALEISPGKRPAGYAQFATFHPTFLYESIYCVVLIGVALWVERRWRLRRGQLAALYLSGYTFGRFWFEQLRIDKAHEVGGLRVNSWIEIAIFLVGIAWFRWLSQNSTVDEGKQRALHPVKPVPVA
jgi:prolipoprotein diacylglyceryl transferase